MLRVQQQDLLLAKGATCDLKNNRGDRPLDMSEEFIVKSKLQQSRRSERHDSSPPTRPDPPPRACEVKFMHFRTRVTHPVPHNPKRGDPGLRQGMGSRARSTSCTSPGSHRVCPAADVCVWRGPQHED